MLLVRASTHRLRCLAAKYSAITMPTNSSHAYTRRIHHQRALSTSRIHSSSRCNARESPVTSRSSFAPKDAKEWNPTSGHPCPPSLCTPPPPVTVAAGSGAAGGADGASRAADGGAIVKQECEQKLAVRSQAATPTAASIKVEAATVKAPIKMQSAPVPYPFDDDSDRVNTLVSLAIDAKNGILYACEASNNRIRKLIIS
eukprot:scaffold206533_cov30-Tisochrysis_lutea.AAC.5